MQIIDYTCPQSGDRSLTMHVGQYIERVCERFGISSNRPANTPLPAGFNSSKADCPTEAQEVEQMKGLPYRALIGCLMWAVVSCRPECLYALSHLSKFLVNPGMKHWKAALHVARYLKNTPERGITLFSPYEDRLKPIVMSGRCDSSHADVVDDRKSTIGWTWIINGPVVSCSKRATHRTLWSKAPR